MSTSSLIFAVLVGVCLPVSRCQRVLAKECPSTALNDSLQPLYVLVLVPFPDSRPGSGFDGGLSSLPGARIARDEINNRSDLLEGYHIELIEGNAEACSRLTAPDGLLNLVEYGIEAKCSPMVAMAGLICSSHTVQLSQVADCGQASLLTLGAANSPIFELESDRFRHLWRFLGSASVYTDATLALMDNYGWKRIGVMHSHGEVFFYDIARHFKMKILRNRTDLSVEFSFGVDGSRKQDALEVVNLIRKRSVTIVALLVNPELAALFLCTAYDEGLVYPHYVFLLFSLTHEFISRETYVGSNCTRDKVTAALRGHIVMFTEQVPDNSSIILDTTGEEYSHFETKYSQEVARVQRDYFKSHGVQTQLFNRPVLATLLYDQLWALALALNSSLPELERNNLSIATNQLEMTRVIESHLSNVSFQGAAGYVEFDSKRGVSTPVHLFVSSEGGQVRRVAIYNPRNTANFRVDINSSDLPGDRLPEQIIVLSPSATVVVYTLATAVALFTTIVLVLYLYYRNHKEVKATSPYLSTLIFVGCYLLCLAAIVEATKVAFELTPLAFAIIVSIRILLLVNGIGLILLTIFINMFRIYQIFFSWMKDLGAVWKSCSMVLIVLLLSVLPNVLLLVLIFIQPPTLDLRVVNKTSTVIYKLQSTAANFHFAALLSIYFGLFVFLILFFAFRTRKIKHQNFKDTKKVTLFVAVMAVCVSIASPLYISLRQSGNERTASLILITAILLIPTMCLLTLYVPKLPPALSLGQYCTHRIPTAIGNKLCPDHVRNCV